jgi:AcrR family transcriptional regulator
VTPQPTDAAPGAEPSVEAGVDTPGRLDRDLLVAAALELVDRHGVARFTMRMLGEHVGHSAMATYRHVAGKDELIALAADSVLAGVEVPDRGSGTPRERLRAVAQNAFLQMAAHPWVAPFLLTRWRTVPNAERVFAAMVEFLSEVEPDRDRARLGVGALRAYLIGWLAGSGLDREAARPDGPRHELSAAAREQFDFGLDAIIVGILVSLS